MEQALSLAAELGGIAGYLAMLVVVLLAFILGAIREDAKQLRKDLAGVVDKSDASEKFIRDTLMAEAVASREAALAATACIERNTEVLREVKDVVRGIRAESRVMAEHGRTRTGAD